MTPRQSRIRELDERIDALNAEYRSLPTGHARRSQILREIAPLGAERRRLGRRSSDPGEREVHRPRLSDGAQIALGVDLRLGRQDATALVPHPLNVFAHRSASEAGEASLAWLNAKCPEGGNCLAPYTGSAHTRCVKCGRPR